MIGAAVYIPRVEPTRGVCLSGRLILYYTVISTECMSILCDSTVLHLVVGLRILMYSTVRCLVMLTYDRYRRTRFRTKKGTTYMEY